MKTPAWALAAAAASSWLVAGCASIAPTQPLACDDSLKSAFKPDAQTTVVAVRAISKGTQLVAVDSPGPITAAIDMCLVKLLVGPGATAEAQRLLALNLGPVPPRIFAGEAAVASLATGPSAVTRGVLDRPRYAEAFGQLYGGDDRLSLAVREATATRREIKRIPLGGGAAGMQMDPDGSRVFVPVIGQPEPAVAASAAGPTQSSGARTRARAKSESRNTPSSAASTA